MRFFHFKKRLKALRSLGENRPKRASVRLGLECLEDRLTPADVALTGIYAPTIAHVGDTIAVTTGVSNYSYEYTSGFSIRYTLSSNPYGAFGIQVQYDYRGGIGAWGSQWWSESIRIPTWLNPGNYWVSSTVYPSAYDWNWGNNTLTSWNSITVSAPASDLAVYSVSAPNIATAGSTISVGVGVGDWSGTPSGSYYVGIYASTSPYPGTGTLIAMDYRPGLSAWSSTWISESVQLPSWMQGTYWLSATVDPWGNVPDANRSNNYATVWYSTTISAPVTSDPNAILNSLTPTGKANGGVQASQSLAQADQQRVMRGNTTKQEFITAGQIYGLPPALLAAMASRESSGGYTLVNGWGDNGNAFGVMQIDKRYWTPDTSTGPFGQAHINQAASILAGYLRQAKSALPGLSAAQKLRYAVAAYNGGPQVFGYANPDVKTYGGDYSADVLARAQFYARVESWT